MSGWDSLSVDPDELDKAAGLFGGHATDLDGLHQDLNALLDGSGDGLGSDSMADSVRASMSYLVDLALGVSGSAAGVRGISTGVRSMADSYRRVDDVNLGGR